MENEKKKIEDFGNKIGGAKKDLARKKKQNLSIEDAANWNEMERKEYIKKKAVWVEPDYKQMVEDGTDKVCVYFIKLIRDKLPAKPLAGWNAADDEREQEAYIKFISEVRDMALQIKTKEDMTKISRQIIDTYTEGRYSLNSYFTNKIYRTLRKSSLSVEREMNDKQFLWEDKDKLLAAYNIGKVGSVSHNSEWNRLDIIEETEKGGQRGKCYYSSESNDRFFSENEWETGKYYIYDNKRQILDINFDTKEAAEEYILQYGNIESSRKEANRRKRFVPPLLEVIRREGSDYRQNIDADGQAMLDTFGFYGGEFGNWERQTERQMNLNFAYDAFKDLAYALDIDDKDVSLGGNLSLAFGARGSGNALAHYERIANVINLTRMKGAGSLGHEFGHALDSFIARATGMRKSFATETFCDITDKVMDAIKYKKSENGWREYTEFYNAARDMDGEYTGYWASETELFARAFACYLKDKLAEKGMQNDYLCGHCESAGTFGEERVRINKAFDEMFAILKERGILHSVTHDVVKNAIAEEQIVEENKTVKQKINTNDELLNIITDAIPDILTAEEYEIYKNDLGENISHLSDQNKFDRFGLGISPVLRFEKVEFEAGTEFNINGTSYKAISTNILATNAKTASEELETVFNNDFSSQKTWEESELRNLLSEKWVSSYILNNEEITAQEEKKTVLATDLKVGDIILINNTTMMDSNFKPVEIAPELVCVNEVNDNGISYKSYDPETNTTTFKSSGFITFELLEKTGFEYKDNSIDIESEKPVESEKPIRIYMGVRGTDEPIANNPRKVFEGIIQSAGLEPTEDISVDETQKMFSSLRIAEIELDNNEYTLEFDVEDEGLIIRDSAANKEYICIWSLARELMSMIAYDNNISRENFVSNEFENQAAAEENITHSPVGNELPDFTDCIDYLKGRMGISGSLLGKMSKWDYSDDDKDRIYDEWVSAYSDKVGYIFDPDYIHYGNAEQPNKNKAFYDYYLEHKDEVLREVFSFVYDEAKEQGDNIRKLLADEVMHGSGVQDGKFRINEFYSKNKDINEFAQFIKNEYGIGGHSGEGEVKFANHDGKGIEIITQNDIVYDFKWNEVAKMVASAIDANTYITENDVKRRIHNARFHLENYSDGMSEQERKYYTDILAEYQLGVATINEQELIDLVKEQIKEDDGVFSDHYSITSPAAVYNLLEGTMQISEINTKYHVADYRYDAEKGEFIVSGNTNSNVRKMIRNALETALSEKNAEKAQEETTVNVQTENTAIHSPVGNEPNKQEQQTPKREQSDAQKGKQVMNNVIVGTIEYKNIKVKKFINNISIEDCQKVVDELTAQGIPFSGLLQYKLQKGTITVSPENYKTACDALEKVRSNSPVEKKNTIIGNKPYKYISDKKFIKANEADIRKLADILTEQNVQFSGCIYNSDNATITVSGAETEKLATAYLNYVRNTSIVNKLADYNFTLVDVQALTVKDKNDNTMSFDSYEDMENAFNDIENEFFHPTYYQLGIVTDAIAEVYAVRAMDSTTGKEKHIEKDADGYYLTFDTVTDAISYVQSNNISIANTDTELEDWKKRDAAIHMDKMQELINQFGDEEHLIIRPDETISWTYFNPDGNNGNGQLVEMEINEGLITEAYEAYRASNDFDEFTNYIFSNAETHLIDADREDFEAHAKQFIAEKDNNDDVYILTTYTDELIERLTDNFTDIRLAKQAEKLDLEAISTETAYDMAVQAKMSIYDKDGNAVAVEELGGEAYATAADVQKWGQIETISNFVDEINSYVSDNPSVDITEYQRDASEEGYEYAIGASEWENTARSLSQGKFEWLKTWLNDVKYNTIFNDITVLTENAADILSDYEETYYVPDKAEPEAVQDTVDIEKIIADKQNEMKDAMNAGDYAKVSELAQELNALTSQKKEQETASHSPVGNEPKELTSFIDDEEKMRDFRKITKEEFLESYSYITEAEYEMTEKEAFCLTVPELDIDVDMRKIDHIAVQTPDNKLIFYYSKNSNDIERAWESDDNSDTAVSVEEVRTDLLNSKAAGFIINVYETGSVNLFAALDYDVNKEFADFVGSMDFEVVKVGSEFSLRDDANFGDIHSDAFNNAAAMTDRLDIYINDYYIEDIAGQMKEAGLDDIVNIDEMTSLESIYNAINANSADDRMKKFFNDNLSDMRKLDLVINKVDAVDLNIAFQEAKIEPTYTIYQVKDGEEYRGVAFNRWKDLKELNIPFDKNNYESVYSGRISDVSRGTSKNWVLDDIYAKFNDNNRPDDFEGNSLSMSDIIVLEDENGRTAHYVDRYGTADVTDLFFDIQKQKIDISKLAEVKLVEDYDRRRDQPDDFLHIHNTITFSNLNSSFHIDRFKDSTLEYDVMPDVDEGHTEDTREGMLIEINEWLDDMRNSYSNKSIVITDTDGKETVIEGQMFEFEASEDRLAFIIPSVGYASIFERDDDGYDYTIYDGNFKEIDGGVYDDTSISIREALKIVMEDNSLDITKCLQISYEQLEEWKNIRAVEDGVIGSNGYAIDEQYKMFEDENGIYSNEVEETVEAMKIPDEVMESDAVEAESAENIVEDESGVYDEEIEETVEAMKIEASEGDGIAADEIEAVVSEMKEESKASLGTHSPVWNESTKPVLNGPSEIKPGDKFTKNGEVYTVVDKPSLYPDDVVVKRTVTTPNYSYDTTHNVGRNDLFSNYTYIGDGTEHKVEPDVSKKTHDAVSRDFKITSDDFNNGGGLKTRFRQNIEAIKTLKAIENEGRAATADEQAVLAKYVGWGGIQEAFDDTKPEWTSEYNELKSLLTEREYADAKGSVNNAHYTSPVVINAIYSALENIGFKGGKILEPAMGTGNFFGTMPEEMKNNSTLSGVELDDITGRIAKQLYQSANITVSGFENTNFTNDYFDAAIGNVPFGDYKVYDKEYNDLNFKIHDYFFAKTLDKVHPGGVVAFVTSQGTMDKKDETVRKYLAQRADLLGAIRLPNNAFKGIAGTEVTTDIIFLQKRDRAIEIDADWIGRDELDNGVMVNKYFADHPEMILGEMVEGNKMFGSGTMCVPIEGADLKEQLAEAIKNIKGGYKEQSKEQKAEQETVVYAPVDSKKFSFVVQEDKLYYRKGGNTMSPADVKARDIPQIKALCEIREKLNKLLDVQVNNLDGINADAIANELNELNMLYDDYVAKYGRLSSKETASVFGEDASYQLVKALEVNDSNGNFERKADVMQKALIKPKQVVQHVDNAGDALLICLAEKFKVDIPFMSNITGMDENTLISELEGRIYQNPAKNMIWETADEYLSGNVREKLEAARDANLRSNVEALERVIPETIEAADIKVKLGTSWIEPQYVKDFILDILNINPRSYLYQNLEVEYSEKTNDWKITGYNKSDFYNNILATEVYGTEYLNALKILDATLNLKTIEIKKDKLDEYGNPVLDVDGRTVRVVDQKATELVQAKQTALQNKFKEWLFDDPDRRANLVDRYNRQFNNTVLREYDGSHLNFVGMNENIKLNPHQVNAVARGLSGGNTLLAHEVGAGKTFEMIAIAMEGKRLGLHNKSMIAVPNHLTEQTGQAFRELYPACNILVATEKDFKPENRKAMMAKIATGDWDAVIVGHSQFDMCALSAEKQIEYINEEIADLEDALESAKRENPKSISVKGIERAKKQLEEKLLTLNDKQKKDDFIEFEKLGIDKLFVDESQEYKNLSTATKMNNVSGVASNGSAKALQLLMKCKYMDEVTGGNGIVFASGTPISNSMTEMYTLSRYLQADKLKEMGIDSFDKWASVFGETETAMEVKPTGDGQYQNKTRFAHFINLPELQTIFREVADVKLASSLNIERPDAKIHNVNVPASRYQRRYVKKLGKRSEACRAGQVDKHIDNMLKITTDGRKIGLDARCIDPNIPDDPASKVNVCINNVFDIWQKTAENRSTQLIFCDLATPQKPKNEDKYLIFRKQEDGTYANIYSGIIRTKDKSPERVLESLMKKLPKDFAEDEMCGVLAEGDIIVSKIVDMEGGMIEHSGIEVEKGGTSSPVTSIMLNDLGTPPQETYEQEMPFCVYDDIKEKLIKMGVPANEIAFIHDCKNNEEKQKLFDKMNKGEVRIMIGSTQKCGAGMNAQAKMIALHDLDAPYRPSDMGQRHGRIERRGNENKEVDIYRYMTEKTFDSYLYQLLENKQTFISQIMTEKTAVRVCEDIDDSVLDFGTAKALCSGNPLAKEKGELMKDISLLNNLKSNHNAARYRLQDAVKDAPRKIRICEKAIELYEQDKVATMAVKKVKIDEDKEVYPITIRGKEYTDRAEGGKELIHLLDSNMKDLHSGRSIEVGKYRGMTINAIATALGDGYSKEIKLEVVGAKRYYTTAVNFESTKYEGNIIRLDNVINSLDKLIVGAKNDLMEIKQNVEEAEKALQKPFEQEAELAEKTARLEVVNAELLAADNEKNACLAIYETLSFIVSEIESPDIVKDDEFIRYYISEKNTKPFVFESLGNGEFFASREDKKNGDVITCCGATFKLDVENKTVELTSFRDDYNGVYEEYSSENPADLNTLKTYLEELDFIDDHDYKETTSYNFHEQLNRCEDGGVISKLDEVLDIADKIEEAFDNGELDKDDPNRSQER